MAGDRITEGDVLTALRTRYAAPAYALLSHVPTATGARHTATIDAISIGLWPSRGLIVHGFEIKVDRGDWLRELAKPQKAEWGAKHCDYWSIVAPPDIVRPGELPATWGYTQYKGGKLKCIKEPVELPSGQRDSKTALPISREFVAAIARKIERSSLTQDDLNRAVAEARADAFKSGEAAAERDERALRDQIKRLSDKIARFEAAAGFSLNDHYEGEIETTARLFAILRRGVRDPHFLVAQFERERDVLSRAQTAVEEAIKAVKAYDELRSRHPIPSSGAGIDHGSVVDPQESAAVAERQA